VWRKNNDDNGWNYLRFTFGGINNAEQSGWYRQKCIKIMDEKGFVKRPPLILEMRWQVNGIYSKSH
jgi:hypothetical protein